MRSVLAWVLRIIGVFAITFACFSDHDDLIDYTMKNSQKIERLFHFAAETAEEFKEKNYRYPTVLEFDSWKDELSAYDERYGGLIDYYPREFPAEAVAKFGSSHSDGFVLRIWRGDWYEYYSSWDSRSTMPVSRSDYYVTGGKHGDLVFYLLLAFFCFVAAHFVAGKNTVLR